MKKTTLLLGAAFLILISGCSPPQHLQYNSHADRTFSSGQTQTTFDLVDNEEDPISRPYSVFVAQDNGAEPYVLITPVVNMQKQSLKNAKLSEGIPVALADIEEMREGMRGILAEWEEPEDGSGQTYDYAYAPAERALGFHPRMLLSFSTYEEGPSLVMNLGEYVSEEAITATETRIVVEAAYSTRVDDPEKIERLVSLLGEAYRRAR